MDVLDVVLLAGGDGRVGQVLIQRDLARVALAIHKLDPLSFLCFLVSKLNHLNVLGVLSIGIDLHELVVVLNGPLLAACWLSIGVPVTVWSCAAVSRLNLSMLMLSNLVLGF